MRIQNNILALNSHRQLSGNNGALGKNLEKLSSGYRINRAGDDAAGLAVSEKMRAQIRGLDTAQKNSADGISLIQTAEGALTEVHSMLNRMVELATSSANGIYTDDDRKKYDAEFTELKNEIDRISQATNFNGINLLDGSLSGAITSAKNAVGTIDTSTTVGTKAVAAQKAKFEIDLSGMSVKADAAKKATIELDIGGAKLVSAELAADTDGTALAASIHGALTTAGEIKIDGVDYTVTAAAGKLTFEMKADPAADLAGNFTVDVTVKTGTGTIEGKDTLNKGTTVIKSGLKAVAGGVASTAFKLTKDDLKDGSSITIGDETYIVAYGKDSKVTAGVGQKLLDLKDLDDTKGEFVAVATARLTQVAKDNTMFSVGQNATAGQVTLTQKDATKDMTTKDKINEFLSKAAAGAAAGAPLTLQVGDTSEKFQKVAVGIADMSAKGLGLENTGVGTYAAADQAMGTVKAAIEKVSEARSGMGALQNRLEHTISNLGVTTENMTAAESRIRDVDMAKEMMSYTKNNILTQAAQAMLAQANQVPQGVLQLLR